jgi:hypothetical protein
MSGSGGIAACRSPSTRTLPRPERSSSRTRAGDAASASRPWRCSMRLAAALVGNTCAPSRQPVVSAIVGPGRSTPTSRRAPSRSPLRGASEMYAAKPLPTRRTKRKAGGAIGGANDEVEAQAPCGTRSGAVIVVLLVLAWAAGWFGTAGRRPRRRGNDAAVNSPGERARRSLRSPPPKSDRGNSGERRTGGAVAA